MLTVTLLCVCCAQSLQAFKTCCSSSLSGSFSPFYSATFVAIFAFGNMCACITFVICAHASFLVWFLDLNAFISFLFLQLRIFEVLMLHWTALFRCKSACTYHVYIYICMFVYHMCMYVRKFKEIANIWQWQIIYAPSLLPYMACHKFCWVRFVLIFHIILSCDKLIPLCTITTYVHFVKNPSPNRLRSWLL